VNLQRLARLPEVILGPEAAVHSEGILGLIAELYRGMWLRSWTGKRWLN
jgi:hypothetical protein